MVTPSSECFEVQHQLHAPMLCIERQWNQKPDATNTSRNCKPVKPGDMQLSTQDTHGFHWKKWIRGSVGRLPRGSLSACGMKKSAKHLVKEKQNSTVGGLINIGRAPVMLGKEGNRVNKAEHKSKVLSSPSAQPLFNPNPETTADVILLGVYRTRLKSSPIFHVIWCNLYNCWLSSRQNEAEVNGVTTVFFDSDAPGTRPSSLLSLFKKTWSRAEPQTNL